MWSFVSHKNNKQWIWLALDVKTREIVGVYVGDRAVPAEGPIAVGKEQKNYGNLCHQFIVSAPFVERDFWEAYERVIPSKRPKSSGQSETTRSWGFPP